MSEPTESFAQPDLDAGQDGDEKAGESGEDAPRVHTEEPAEGPDDGSVTT
jgi:hypothetical protein